MVIEIGEVMVKFMRVALVDPNNLMNSFRGFDIHQQFGIVRQQIVDFKNPGKMENFTHREKGFGISGIHRIGGIKIEIRVHDFCLIRKVWDSIKAGTHKSEKSGAV